MHFSDLGLKAEIQRAVAEQGYDTPTPIQQQAIPAVLAGHDLMATAQTGTGKTAGFTLPILHLLTQRPVQHPGPRAPIRALVLTPTRELAMQVAEAFRRYASHLPGFRVVPIYGGQSYHPQLTALSRGVHVIVGTPGR